ncbi:hypothetical protein FHS29_003020 [Saccharothrix tamanrassetensis]|uniref:DUF998 domain-containing protein n=1 Tax=Saccharothrix tamanrassetensis TaxID=1051531 RepID=A0A841CJA3_9PSEU|nr:DUF998 domain-containing protein [Saccharothrix tamanrassetensis]MBB5956434.1 hypothetical protein [Saccharothrix tamanrassetensis]
MTVVETRSDVTKLLLGCGVLAGPLYLVTGFAQAFTREGFDLKKHPMSFLSLGEGGWVQIANFVLSGLLFLAMAFGVREAIKGRRGGTWGPVLLGIFAVGMIAGGVFVADPAFGFPVGAPEGQPEVLSWHGTLHGVAFFASFPALIASCFVFARRFSGGWSWFCVVAGLVSVAPMAFMGSEWGTVVLYGVAVVSWLWVSAVAAKLRAEV